MSWGDIRRCHACGVQYRDPMPHRDELLSIYRSELYFELGRCEGIGYRDYRADERMYRRYFARKVRELGRFARPGRVFEIGAAAGYFLDEARLAGWSTAGIEPSPRAARHARDELGLDVATAAIEDVTIQPDAFDAVAALQTLEHLEDPFAALRAIHAWVRPGGSLLLTTPDTSSVIARVMGRRWPSYRPEHIWYFDRSRLSKLLGEAGWDVLRARPDDPLLASLDRVMERAAHFYGMRNIPLGRLGSTVTIPVWLGDVEIIARRRR